MLRRIMEERTTTCLRRRALKQQKISIYRELSNHRINPWFRRRSAICGTRHLKMGDRWTGRANLRMRTCRTIRGMRKICMSITRSARTARLWFWTREKVWGTRFKKRKHRQIWTIQISSKYIKSGKVCFHRCRFMDSNFVSTTSRTLINWSRTSWRFIRLKTQ